MPDPEESEIFEYNKKAEVIMYEWIDRSLALSKSVFQECACDWDFNLSEPATIEEIHECERELGLSLPPSHVEFLLKYNGAHLFRANAGKRSDSYSWWANSGVLVFGTKSILDYSKFLSRHFEEPEYKLSPVPIAYLGRICTGDFCALDMDELIEGENPVMACDPCAPSYEWRDALIAASFEEWLRKMFNRIINHKSPPEYWFADTLQDDSLRDLREFYE